MMGFESEHRIHIKLHLMSCQCKITHYDIIHFTFKYNKSGYVMLP